MESDTVTVAQRKEKILNLLKQEKPIVETIVLVGESGIGKTWMAREMSYYAVEEGLFDITLWAFLTRKYDSAPLLESDALYESISRQLCLLPTVEESEVDQDDRGETEEKKKWEDLPALIFKRLAGRKVLLIVEIIGESKMNEEAIVTEFKTMLKLDSATTGYKVLITGTQTARNESPTQTAPNKSLEVIDLKPLSVEESLKLLHEIVGSEVYDVPAIKDIAKDFMNKIKRLPSAIALLAKALIYFGPGDSGLRMLNSALEEASANESYNIKHLLRSGYDMLPNSILKEASGNETYNTKDLLRGVLIDCCWHDSHIFRDRGSVHYNELIAYWMVEGLLGHVNCIEHAYEEGHCVLMELIDCQVLKNLDSGYVRMMDRTKLDLDESHRLGFCGTANLGLATVFEGNEKVFGIITKTDGMMKTLPNREEGKKLSTLLVDEKGCCSEVLIELLKSNPDLQVLVLFNRKLESLLPPLSKLHGLRVLLLRECDFLEKIDCAIELQNLVVLEISGPRSLKEIPDDFFNEMPLLRSLNLSGLLIHSLPSSLYNLSKLAWLILRGCSSLENLDSLKKLGELMVLDLSGATSFHTIKDKTFLGNPKLQLLNFSQTKIKCIPLVKNLGELTHLLLSGCTDMERLRKMDTLKNLQVLDLSGASKFNVFHDQSLEEKDFLDILDLSGTAIKQLLPNISDPLRIYLKGCKQLKELPFIETLKRLEVLDVSGTLSLVEVEDKFFENLQHLRILNLSETSIRTLQSLSNLSELRELLLSHCSSLEKLPDLNSLEKLEVLDLSGCSAFDIVQDQSFEKMSRLRRLDLSETKIEFLPLLSNPCNLRRLSLKRCTELKSLPQLESLSQLEELNLRGVRSLGETGADFLKKTSHLKILDLSETPLKQLPPLSNLTDLTQLFLSSCSLLKDVPGLDELSKIEVLDLSGTAITNLPSLDIYSNLRQLLLRDCSSLEGFIHLKMLDLLGATVEDLPYGILKLKNLEQLDLPEMKDNQGADSREMNCSSEELNLYQWSISSFPPNSERYSFSVSSTQFLQFLNKNPSLWETSFTQFHFCVQSIESQNKNGNRYFYRNELPLLRDIYFRTSQFSQFREQRTLEIHGFQNRPKGLEDILSHADCVFLIDNMLERWVSDLGASNLKMIKGCWLEGCKEMKSVFKSEETEDIAKLGKTLESLGVSHAIKLTTIYEGNLYNQGFPNLKYLYLDCCPELSVAFPSSQFPENLKVLQIKFCDKLKTLFGQEVSPENCKLPKLEALHLWELPELESIRCELPSLQTLKVWGCLTLVNVLSSPKPPENLEMLQVSYCDKLETVFEHSTSTDYRLQKLKTLHMRELPKLERIGAKLSTICERIVTECPKIRDFPVA